jgi:hypothetical protein
MVIAGYGTRAHILTERAVMVILMWLCGLPVLLLFVASPSPFQPQPRSRPPHCQLAQMPVAVAANASAFELGAAQELALWAGRAAHRAAGPLPVVTLGALRRRGQPYLAVGADAALATGVSAAQLSSGELGEEGFVLGTTTHGAVVLSGAPSASRGALYAVYHLLHLLGVRFLAENATVLPASCPAVMPPALRGPVTRHRPAFEYRAVNSWAALQNPAQAQRLHLNDKSHTAVMVSSGVLQPADVATGAGSPYVSQSQSCALRQPRAIIRSCVCLSVGGLQARGYFVHSIYQLLQANPINGGPRQGAGPPTALFNTHREWFWPRDRGPTAAGQVCWTNASLIAQLILATKSILRSQPDARIISISQNDNLNQCQSPEEMAVARSEGSPAGPLLRAINAIAAAIEPEFPQVAIDTLACTLRPYRLPLMSLNLTCCCAPNLQNRM